MKINFKTNLLVFIAGISLSSCGVANAMQSATNEAPVGSGVIQGVVESPNMGAFGAIRPIEDDSGYFDAKELPPIVSPQEAEKQTSTLPPIVSGSDMPVPEFKVPQQKPIYPEVSPNTPQSLPPIVSSEATGQTLQPMSPMTTAPMPIRTPMQMGGTMLAPLESVVKQPELGSAPKNDPMMAPPTIVQASQLPVAANEEEIQRTQWTPQGHNSSSVSSAGVPLYPRQDLPSVMTAPQQLPPIISSSSQLVAPIKPMAPATPVSGSGLPPIVDSAPIPVPAVAPFPNNVGSSVPIVSSQPPIVSSQPLAEGYPAPTEPTFATAETYVAPEPVSTEPVASYSPSYFSSPPIEPPVVQGSCGSCGSSCDSGASTCSSCSSGGCGSCGGGGCTSCGVAASLGASACSSCGNNGCFDPAHVSSRFGASGSVSDSRRYLHADALLFDRDDGLISNSNFGSLNNFDWSPGWRVTYGAKSDALRGREITYMGIIPVEQSVSRSDALGRINARFTSADGFTGSETSAFRNATAQTELKETSLHALEYNCVTWGWDVIKSFSGIRYIHVDDEYQMTSTNLSGESGVFEMRALNNMIGPHIGGEIFYDVGYRLSYSMFSKAGVYANFNKVDTRMRNAGAQFVDVEDGSATISSSLELGLLAHYQLSRTARMRFGYNALWIGNVASVSDNFNPALTPTVGTSSSDSDDMFFHGISLGLEIFR